MEAGFNPVVLYHTIFLGLYATNCDSIRATGLSSWLARATLKMKAQKLSS
jgi:hypothetical protein